MPNPSAVIFGCAGLSLSDEEQSFFKEADPLGFILFARNIQSPDQVRTLTDSLRECVGRPDAPILIDQEGGRVQRLKPPFWRDAPAARWFGDLYRKKPEAGKRAAHLNSLILADDLLSLGIDVDCLPCLDLARAETHAIIGDRSYGEDVETIINCGQAAAEGLLAGGCFPVIKHVPGHGRATLDSHLDLPRITTSLLELEETDFAPFKALSDQPLGMTAHIIYDALDPSLPATQSEVAVHYIRDVIGFDGLLMTDDLSMKALAGSFEDRARLSLAAGCDIVLHCNGDMAEMMSVRQAVPDLLGMPLERWQKSVSLRNTAAQDMLSRFNRSEALEELGGLLPSLQ